MQQPPASAPATPTSTGILPPGVSTVGSRPPADGLPPAAEPQSAPPQTRPIPGRTVPVGIAPEGVVVDSVTRIVAVAKRKPTEILLLNADTGQMVAADTRGDAIRMFEPLPTPHQVAVVTQPGGPYGWPMTRNTTDCG